MKNLFTYPLNPSTNYIDPDYIGDANSGMTRRIDDLLDETYKDWLGLDPVADLGATTPDIESNLSRFINNFDANSVASHVSIEDFWQLPLISCTMKLIDSVDIVTAVYTLTPEETIFTTTADHEFTDGQLLLLNNFNDQMADYNGQTFYVKVLTATTLQLTYDSALTDFLIVGANIVGTLSTVWQTAGSTIGNFPGLPSTAAFYPAFSEDAFELDMNTFVPDAGYDPLSIVSDGTPVEINTVEYNGADLATNEYYTKAVGNLRYELYEESGLINRVKGSDLTGNNVQQVNGRLRVGYDENWTAAQYYSHWINNDGFFMQYDVSPTDSDNFTNSVVPNWINYPLSQQQQDFIGFTGQNNPPSIVQEDYSELVWAPTIPQASGYSQWADAWKPEGQSGFPGYYVFNKYRIIDTTGSNDRLKMYFQSVLNGTNGVDPINSSPTTYAIDYYWEVLTKTDYMVGVDPSNTWHCLPMFNGYHFENFARFGTYNLPDTAEIVNQPGMPVLDTRSSTLTFNTTTSTSGLAGDMAVLTKSFATPNNANQGYSGIKTYLDEMNIVVWKPGTNLDDYKMSFDEYGLLNIMEKDGSGNWTVPIYAVFERNDPTSPNMPYYPWNAPVLNWDISIGSVGAPCFIAQTDNITSYYRLYPNDPAKYLPGNIAANGGSANGAINLLALQTLWPDLNLTLSSSLDVEISPCPYNIGVDDKGPNEWDSSNYSARKLWDNTNQPAGLYYQNTTLGAQYPNMYENDYFNSGNGISCYTDSYPQSGGARPTMFHMSNRTTANIQNTGDINVEFKFDGLPIATQGEFAIDTTEPLKYEVDTLTLKLPGNTVYSYKDTNNATALGARIDPDKYWRSGAEASQSYLNLTETPPEVAVTVDTNGRISGASLTGTPTSEGLFTTGEDILLPVVALADTYVPPVVTPAEAADVWDTDDEWATTGFDSRKYWPTVVTPSSAKINYSTPSTVNKSQNGIKYTRASGFTKWTLEVEYPPMSADEFREFHAIAQAANGQAVPFYFKLRDANNNPILWSTFDKVGTSNRVVYIEDLDLGDTTTLLSGFLGNETNAFQRGEVFIGGSNENGFLHTTINTVNSNAFGEAKIRTAMPARSREYKGDAVYKDPFHAVVTLNNDNFNYSVDTAGFYNLSVEFELDGWK